MTAPFVQTDGVASPATAPNTTTPRPWETEGVLRLLTLLDASVRAEVEAGRIAEERGTSPDVRRLGADVAHNYETSLGAIYGNATSSKGGSKLQVPALGAEPTLAAQRALAKETLQRLGILTGEMFNMAYVTDSAHRHVFIAELAEQGEAAALSSELAAQFHSLSLSARNCANRARSLVPRMCRRSIAHDE
jgi:hypothetical protein